MDTIPVASFLAGSLLSILMPTLLLIGLVVWYHIEVIRRTPEPPPRSRSRSQESTERQPASDQPPTGESRPSGA